MQEEAGLRLRKIDIEKQIFHFSPDGQLKDSSKVFFFSPTD